MMPPGLSGVSAFCRGHRFACSSDPWLQKAISSLQARAGASASTAHRARGCTPIKCLETSHSSRMRLTKPWHQRNLIRPGGVAQFPIQLVQILSGIAE